MHNIGRMSSWTKQQRKAKKICIKANKNGKAKFKQSDLRRER